MSYGYDTQPFPIVPVLPSAAINSFNLGTYTYTDIMLAISPNNWGNLGYKSFIFSYNFGIIRDLCKKIPPNSYQNFTKTKDSHLVRL